MTVRPSLRPRDASDIAEAISAANSNGETIELRGGGSKTDIGLREESTCQLDFSGLSRIVDYNPAELVLTAEPGAKIGEIERLLAAHGQMLAFEPMDYGAINGTPPGRSTLGGALAANSSGPRRLSAGAARDHFLGFMAVSGRGEVFKAGGRVVKNVTGFDLAKLMAGSWGSLAALTEVTVRVLPKPPAAVTLAIANLTTQQGTLTMSRALGSSADISGAAYLPADIPARVRAPTISHAQTSITALRLEGFEPSIAARVEHLRSLFAQTDITILGNRDTEQLWLALRDVLFLADARRILWRISAPPMNGCQIVEDLVELHPQWFADWGGGLVWLSLPQDCVDEAYARRVHDAAQRAGGHASLVRAPESLHRLYTKTIPQHRALAKLSKRIKAAFDPRGVLNPGRMSAA